jgi:hypothetical protein
MKNHLIALLFALIIPACATEAETELVEVAVGKADTWNTTPRGEYRFEPTLNGSPSSGDLLTLSLTPSGTFRSTVSDELSGTTSHTGTYRLYKSAPTSVAQFYIYLREGTQTYKFEYSIDLVDNSTLWLRRAPSHEWIGMSSLGDDCSTAGCPTGESCNECFGENVCLPQGTSC